MAWEWVAPVGTATVGLAGIAATYLSGRRQVSAARDVAHDQAEAALRSQREERQQRRIEGAYTVLLEVVGEGLAWLDLAYGVDVDFSSKEKGKLPKLPERISNIHLNGSLNAVCSPAIRDMTLRWRGIMVSVRETGNLLIELRNGSSTPTRVATFKEFDERYIPLHVEGRKLAAKIHEQAWRELKGEDSGQVQR
jgi:hypothetical protein